MGVVSKNLKQGACFHLFLCFSSENKLKTCRIPGVGPVEDIYKVILLLFHVFRPSSLRLGHCMIAVHHYRVGSNITELAIDKARDATVFHHCKSICIRENTTFY